jgi:hypothetical protein
MRLIIKEGIAQTVLKRRAIDAASLPEAEKRVVKGGQSFDIKSQRLERNHYRVEMKELPGVWYAYAPHVVLVDDKGQRFSPVEDLPVAVKLNVPYKSQRDNSQNPDGACNVTSMAMCAAFFNVKPNRNFGYEQLEDVFYRWMEVKGFSRHDPHHLKILAEAHGLKDEFRTTATIEQVKRHLAKGNPCVIHGYFTSFGHIVVLVGYDDDGFLVHDPYGEWNNWGYDRNDPFGNDEKGKYVHYSYAMIRRLCIPDGNFWVHLIAK